MRQYGCLRAIPLSFFSRNLYRDVVHNWGFGVILYLILLLVICWAFLSVTIQATVTSGYVTFANKYIPQIPEMTIKEGELTTPENKPYLIKDPDEKDPKKEVFAIVDTSGKYTTLEDQSASILVTKNAVLYKDDNEVKIQEFSKDFDLHIVPSTIQDMGHKFVKWSWVLFLPVFLMFSFFYRIIEALIYALIGKLFASLSEVRLTYGELFKISIFAMTPAIILGTIFDWFVVSIPFQWVIFLVISLMYLVFGINSLRVDRGIPETKGPGV